MVTLQRVESTNKKTKCSCCEEYIFTGEKYDKVLNGRRCIDKYCLHPECQMLLQENWGDELTTPDDNEDGERGLRRREEYAAYQAAGCVSSFYEDADAGYIR